MKKEKKEIKGLSSCTACIGPWLCNNCRGTIVSYSKVVRPISINGVLANRFFCTRSCFREFKEKYFKPQKKMSKKNAKKDSTGPVSAT